MLQIYLESQQGGGNACKICLGSFAGRDALIEHLREAHELLEILSYAASTMALEQERDREAQAFYRRYQELGRELKGGGPGS